MEWWQILLVSVGAGVVLGFWGWVAVKIIYLDKELSSLKASRENDQEDRRDWLTWLTRVEATVNKMNERLARMEGRQNNRKESEP